MKNIQYEELIKLVSYNPKSGVFRWKYDGMGGYVVKGAKAGNVSGAGYLQIGFKGVNYLAHRLAWMFMNECAWASVPILDHIDGNRLNCRWTNLRSCSVAQNAWNSRGRPNKSGVKGVFKTRSGRWLAYLQKNKKMVFYQLYDSLEEAASAIRIAREIHHGEFACHDHAQPKF